MSTTNINMLPSPNLISPHPLSISIPILILTMMLERVELTSAQKSQCTKSIV